MINEALIHTQYNLLYEGNNNSNNSQHTEVRSKNVPLLAFSVPYSTTHIGAILRKPWHIIEKNPTLSLLWPQVTLVSYKRNPNIKYRIVHSSSKLYCDLH